jgi:hypothetical protein
MGKKSERVMAALEPDLFRLVMREAKKQRCSTGTIVRQALDKFFSPEGRFIQPSSAK